MSVRLVKEHEKYIVLHEEQKVGEVKLSDNPFHAGNCYVKLSMEDYIVDFASELFEKLSQEEKRPLQAMLSSEESDQIVFLEAGGFQCKRKCYEVEVSREDYLVCPYEKVDLGYCEKGSAEYDLCGQLLYRYYAETHKAINPLTADYETFAEDLPEKVYYQYTDEDVVIVAFVEENEIAYVASVDKINFSQFARTVVERLFDKYDVIYFEADDCDPAAMELKSLFVMEEEGTFDTYVREYSKLYLHIPTLSELWYRKKLMEDCDTMSYNKGYEAFSGYDSNTGCIAFPESEWKVWYEYFVGQEPERFYAYIVRKEDDCFIGEVNLHKSSEGDFHEVGIVIEAKYRGHGYSGEALKLLVDYGFKEMKVKEIHNSFEVEREAALRTHLAVGFREYARRDGLIDLVITDIRHVS